MSDLSPEGAGEATSPAAAGPSRALARAGLIVTAAFFASRVLGYVRVEVFSAIFGVGARLDDYYAAFRIPDLVFQLVAAGALGAALVPVLAGLFARGEDERAWRVLSTVVNLLAVALLILVVLAFLLAPWLVPIMNQLGPADVQRTIELTRLMLLSPLFLTLGAVASSALNALDLFTAAAVGPLLYNVAIIGCAVLLAPTLGIESLAVGVVLGALLNALVQVPQLVRHRGFNFRLRIDLRDPAAREALLLLIPRAIGLSVTQITFFVNTSLATTLGAGALTAYTIAFTVFQVPLGIIGLPLGVVLLPSLSRARSVGAIHDFATLTVRSVRLLLYVMLFLTAVAIVLRTEAITLLFDYGRFEPSAIPVIADTLLVFLIGLAGQAIIIVLARAFYAAMDTRTPVLAAGLSVLVNVAVSITTVGPLGLRGLALGIAMGEWFEAAFLLALLARRAPGIDVGGIARFGAVSLGGGLLAGLTAAAVMQALLGVLGTAPGKLVMATESGVALAAAGLVFVGYSRLLRVPELAQTISLIRVALRRETPAARR